MEVPASQTFKQVQRMVGQKVLDQGRTEVDLLYNNQRQRKTQVVSSSEGRLHRNKTTHQDQGRCKSLYAGI